MRYLLMLLVFGFTVAALAPTFDSPASLFAAMLGGLFIGAALTMLALSRVVDFTPPGGDL